MGSKMVLKIALLVPILLMMITALSPKALAFTPAQVEEVAIEVKVWRYISMAISVVGAAASSAFALIKICAAGFALAAERPETLGRLIIFAGLAEGLAIYGLFIALLMWLG